ncbi:hypothetical protein K458DRAFT_157335 [Lentithecium fluviatile CBS 122367]|uniref:DUF4484 domain-containing protein n=1 Tax=Lentithecium fluviatile CBS 122367 TaxID=1168545 RepID=A0A6G1IHF7_9PLEO|nr:hypothetical protein K458DRAFT_157335 [Lentithecium fluviatile CBS 122367]
MSASTGSSTTDVEVGAENEVPQLSALFLIRFDKKVGYTIAWKRSAVDVILDGAVEFKSLPSGLHDIQSDLVYFVHEGYAGLSAFAKGEASAEERNANFVSVGILVSRAYGRLGRSWLLAARLRKLATALADDVSATTPLEEFWDEQSRPKGKEAKEGDAMKKGHSRARALSTITAVVPSDQRLPPFHPALSMLKYVEVFGPLVFRLQQAALLRKRILFVGSAPVRVCCEFVYNLSVLSSIPPHAAELLSPGTEGLLRLPALFSIGVHDIPELERLQNPKANGAHTNGDEISPQGWVACTTDEIITTKKQLYDIVVEMPPTYDTPPLKRVWPTMKTADGAQIKASQRDLKKYKMLHWELWKHRHDAQANEDDDSDRAALLSREEENEDDVLNETFDDSIVEPITWSRLAYNGFMWWASAGEQHAYTSDERDRDRDLLGDLSDYHEGLPTAVIAYFHRSTTLLVNTVNGLIERSDEDDGDEDGEDGVLVVDKDDISRMGLDTWSEADKAFLSEFVWLGWGRGVDVRGAGLRCCGVTIPVF